MRFRVDNEVHDGEMTIKLVEDKDTKDLVVQCTLILPKFILSFEKVSCEVISINSLSIDEVIIGTREMGIVYLLTSKDFMLNGNNIDIMLSKNIQEYSVQIEGEDIEP